MGDNFFTAAGLGDEEEVIQLLDADPALLERKCYYGNRPLAWAASRGQLGVVTVLIARGANIEGAGTWGRTALHNAAEEGHEEVVAWLLDKGADARSRDDNGMTPLIMASGSGHPGVLKMLYQHMQGQGLDDGDDQRWTALHFGTYAANEKVVRSLLLAGADPTITDNEGTTPRALAEQNDKVMEMIWQQRRAGCVAVFQWWQGELERRALLSRATCLHKAYTTQRDLPTSQVPTYLEARVAARHAVPVVEVVSPQSQQQQQQQSQQQQQQEAEESGKNKPAGEGGETQGAEAGEEEEETRHAVLEYVVKALNEALLTELLDGFHCGNWGEEEEGWNMRGWNVCGVM